VEWASTASLRPIIDIKREKFTIPTTSIGKNHGILNQKSNTQASFKVC